MERNDGEKIVSIINKQLKKWQHIHLPAPNISFSLDGGKIMMPSNKPKHTK